MTTPNTPNRTYYFGRDETGVCWVAWVDTWYNRFDRDWLVCTSAPRRINDWLGLRPVTYTIRILGQDEQELGTKQNSVDMYGGPGGADSVVAFAAGPAMLGLSASFQFWDLGSSGGTADPTITDAEHHLIEGGLFDVLRNRSRSWGTGTQTGPARGAPDPATVLSQTDLKVILPGDFRRPGRARTTAALSDDELLMVNGLASNHGVTGPQLMAILLELTGARRTAYHPDGYYGIANLQQTRLQSVLTSENLVGPPPLCTIQDYMNASAIDQLAIADPYLNVGLGNQGGVVPVFLCLAIGDPPPVGSTAVHATPRLQPWSNGVSVVLSELEARINARATELTDEFNARLPASFGSLGPPA